MNDPARKGERRRRATYEDLLAAPEHMVAEIIDGELVLSPRPASPHAFASSSLGADLVLRFGRGHGDDSPGGWWILDEPQLRLGDEELVPDLAGWLRERVPEFPNVARHVVTPDWVCEIVSPSTARIDRVKKMPVYSRASVPCAWLVDPLARTLEVYRLEQGRWVVAGVYDGEEPVRAEPFEAVAFDLTLWWPPSPPPPPGSAAAESEPPQPDPTRE